jgi:cysteine desulfurase/selenocysteine lyase
VADAVGFHAALDYLAAADPVAVHAHETRLTRLALDLLAERGVRTFGPDDAAERAGVVSFEVKGVHPDDVAQFLDGLGIAVRAGHHCAQPLMRRLGVIATARASFYLYNTEAEVRQLADGVAGALEYFGR